MQRKRIKNDDPTDIDGFMGPWARYENEKHSSKPSEEDAAILAEYKAKKKKRRPNASDKDETKSQQNSETSQLHIKDPYDYQGRSFLVAPRTLDGVNLYSDTPPDSYDIPRTLTHTYKGHTKPITATQFFPRTAHLVLSSSLDGKVKLWEIYNEKRCVLTYSGHVQGVRTICFDRTGARFVSGSYDKYVKLWNTETGQCLQRFTNGKMAYCLKFHPDEENSHLFLAGMSNNKIICWDCRSGEIVQEYDRHLGAVNSITFVDENRKFVSSSDDKSLRVWEWDIPVDVKYIADPTLHSMPAVTSSPDNKWLLCQSMENKIQAFSCHNKFKLDNKKIFQGHMVAGYACVPDFSRNMKMVISGDADGKIFFWSWNSTKIIKSFKAHDKACISVMWHPHERHKLVSAGWDNLIKVWE
jgi:pre-mRNA-processing factor 17